MIGNIGDQKAVGDNQNDERKNNSTKDSIFNKVTFHD